MGGEETPCCRPDRAHGQFARGPVGGADLTGVSRTYWKACSTRQKFHDVATNRKIVDGGVLDDAIGIDDEQTRAKATTRPRRERL